MSGTGSIKGGFAGGMRRPKARDILFNKLSPGSGLKAEAGPGQHSKDGWFPFLSPVTHGRGGGVCVCAREQGHVGTRAGEEGTSQNAFHFCGSQE